jgi:chloramphenicol 3-O-phosphotransferase
MPSPVLLLTGAPGAGKSTVSRALVASATGAAVHLHTDDFYAWIRKGFIEPWKMEARQQNTVVVNAIVDAVARFSNGGYEVIVDGILGPWLLDPFRERRDISFDYVVLRPSEVVTLKRGTSRQGERALRDEAVISQMWKAFENLGELEHHALDTSGQSAEETARALRDGRAQGRFRLR